MSKNQKSDSEFFREAIADAKAIRENAIETAKDQLGEAFTPRLQSMLSQTIQQEMEGMEDEEDYMEEEEEEDEEIELELDVEDDEEEEEEMEDMEDMEDEEELDLEEVMAFLEAASTDDRHSDADMADDHSEKGPDHAGPDMLDTDTEEVPDGHHMDDEGAVMEDVMEIIRQLEEEADEEHDEEEEMMEAFLAALREEDDYMDYVEDEMEEGDDYMDQDEDEMDEVFEIDLNEFGVTGTSREAMGDMADLSGPYMQDADEFDLSGLLDISDEPYDPHELQTGETGYEDIDDDPLSESINFNALLRELEEEDEEHEEEMNEAVKQLREENAGLKNELKKHRQVVQFLRDKINETNLINSKLLYTNRLFKRFGLGETQKLRVIEAFDRTKNVREAKLVYTTLAENFSKNSSGSKKTRRVNESKKSKKTQLAEAIKRGINSKKSGGSTKPSNSKKILKEGGNLRNRMKKLANINS